MPWFINYYRCPRCAETWCDEWSAQCDDDCPKCGNRHISPYKSEDSSPEAAAVLEKLAETYRWIDDTTKNLSAEAKLALLLAHKAGVLAAVEEASDE